MSSTSNEVCELWNGQEIVRVMGSGPICELIILFPDEGGEREEACGTTTPQEPLAMELKDALLLSSSEPAGSEEKYLKEYCW